MEALTSLVTSYEEAFNHNTFVKLTLSKPHKGVEGLKNIYVKPVIIKGDPMLSFTYRFETNDKTKNFNLSESIIELEKLSNQFSIITLFSTTNDFIYQVSKKGKSSFRKSKATFTTAPSLSHDRQKEKRATHTAPYLHELGITNHQGEVIPKMADKFRQINKYLEIIESLIKDADLPDEIRIVDMGSGKGYLTFALYDYLKNKGFNINVTGIELRNDLVNFCNAAAANLQFDGLNFVCQPIEEYDNDKIDILIALHACDTATDDAIYKGLISKAALIICAPCCHKQIRKQVKGVEQENPILKYGIFKERQFEMVTDTIRALILEDHKYGTKVFEFISNEHTRKNVMLVGIKSETKNTTGIKDKITSIKGDYGIQEHYLETLLNNN